MNKVATKVLNVCLFKVEEKGKEEYLGIKLDDAIFVSGLTMLALCLTLLLLTR